MNHIQGNTHLEVPRSGPQSTLRLLVESERVYISPDIIVPKHGPFGSFEEFG